MVGDILQPTHLLFILIVALLVLGPKRLPEVARTLGTGLRDFRAAISGEHSDDHVEHTVPSAGITGSAYTDPTVAPVAPEPPTVAPVAPEPPADEPRAPEQPATPSPAFEDSVAEPAGTEPAPAQPSPVPAEHQPQDAPRETVQQELKTERLA